MRASLLLLVSACNLAPKPVDTDTGTPPDDSGTPSTDGPTVYDIRNGVYGDGEQVTLEGIVVTSPHTNGDEGFFVQEPAGGAKSGLYVWGYNGVADVFAEPGDEVTVTGTVTDYYGWTEFVIDSADKVTITGSAAIPAPVALGDGAGVDWDDYESVPVLLEDQTVVSEDDYGNGLLSSGIKLDDGFTRLDYTCRGSFATLAGIVFYTYEEWSLNPVSDADATGYADAEPVDASAYAIQHDGVCGPVNLTGVVATSDVWEDDNGAYVFVQDEGGGESTGIVVFLRDTTADVTVGWMGDVSGTVNQYYGLAEIVTDDAATLVQTGTGTPVASLLDAAPADWESWESCLVTLSDVEVTADESYGQVPTNYADVFVDDLFYDFDVVSGDTWASVTGPLWYSFSEWKVEPRTADDLL